VTPLFERVKEALGGTYALDRELGRGGMATVFLARELHHPRQVAIKVLQPDLAAVIGPDRFQREIAIAAGLTHPHILTLYDSGESQGLLYYVMPYVEGESLRARLDREHMLPIDETLAIARQVGDALAYAHNRGIIHRDIKPENILLSGNQAMVADFGVARAIDQAGGDRLTETGLAVGTVAYMSPEQAVGSRDLDPRSDQYSFACTIYEALVGEPPFTGRDPRAIVARHTLDPAPPLRTIRSTVPPQVEAAILRALAKLPVDRHSTVTAFVDALHAGSGAGAVPATPAPRAAIGLQARLFRSPRAALAMGVAAILVVLVGFWITHRRPVPPVDASLVAILPFKVSGEVDTTLLSPTSITELLRTKLGNGSRLRAADPALVVREWRRAGGAGSDPLTDRRVSRIAEQVGAARVVVGEAAGTATEVSFSARLLDTRSGTELARVDRVAGPPDSVVHLLDQLAARLLLGTVGDVGGRLEDLATENLSALHAYLEGLASYRSGKYADAAERFQRAVEIDTAFALAGLGLAAARILTDNNGLAAQGIDLAWAHRDRLGARDQILLHGMAGAGYPGPSSALRDLRLWERIVDSIPDRWEASYELGDMLFHWGPAVGRDQAHLLSANAFRMALRHDSTFAPGLEHLIDLAIASGDSAEVRRLSRRYFAADSLGDHADYVRWRVGVALGNRALADSVMSRLPTLSPDLLDRISSMAQLDGIGLDDAVLATAELRRRAKSQVDLWQSAWTARELDANIGRVDEAPRPPSGQLFTVPVDQFFTVVMALFWDGDSVAAAHAVRELGPLAAGPLPRDGSAGTPIYMDICIVGLWQAASGDAAAATRAATRLRSAIAPESGGSTTYIPLCAAILDAEAASTEHSPAAGAALDRLDSMATERPGTNAYILLAATATVARLREAAGDNLAALAATRRRPYVYGSDGTVGLSSLLREEGRLAALTGDREGAIRAYQHYLRLRRNPDPRHAAEAADVKRALAELSTDRP
jgi:tetratricopeptide (TPR) repeat protein